MASSGPAGFLSRPAVLTVLVLAALVAVLLMLPFGSTPVLVGLLATGLFGLALTLGTGIGIAGCVLTGARWWQPIRPLGVRLLRLLPVPLVVIGAVLVLGRSQLYPWTSESVVEASEILRQKIAWLSEPFFLFRGLVVLLAWWALTRWLGSALERAIVSSTEKTRRRLVRASVVFVLALGPTLSIASWDWAMSLEPVWFSTMYGVYLFSGFFLAGLAVLAALVSVRGGLPGLGEVGEEVRHDLGKLVFAFSAFWAYIWYCQYMLIWYADLPEEATYYELRLTPEWSTLFWLVPVLSFVVPFLVLMPEASKRHRSTLFQVSLVVLAGRWLDLYVMVAPPTDVGRAAGLLTAAISLALLAGLGLWLRQLLRRPDPADVGSTPAPVPSRSGGQLS